MTADLRRAGILLRLKKESKDRWKVWEGQHVWRMFHLPEQRQVLCMACFVVRWADLDEG